MSFFITLVGNLIQEARAGRSRKIPFALCVFLHVVALLAGTTEGGAGLSAFDGESSIGVRKDQPERIYGAVPPVAG